jgi:hypothetical protein
MTTAQKAVIIALLILGLLGAAWVAKGRIAVERSNRTVALCLDDLEVRQLAALMGKSPVAVMQQFKAAGVNHLAVSEQTLGQLLQTGQLRADYAQHGPSAPGQVRITSSDPALMDRVNRAITRIPAATSQDAFATVPSAVLGMQSLGLGYDPSVIAAARTAGLRTIARPMPDFLYTPGAVAASLKTARVAGADIVLFNGVSIAGGTKLAKQTAAIMKRLGLKFGYVELVPQEGAPALASALKYQIIRTHSISQEEMTKTSPGRGLDRFTLAVTERNIRLCYIRLLLQPQPDLLKANTDYITSISSALRKSGYVFGEPTPLQHFSLGKPALVLLTLGLVGGGLCFLQLVFAMPRRCFWILLIIGVLIALGGSFVAFNMVRSLVALLAAIIFPSLAVLHTAYVAGKRRADAPLLPALGLTAAAAGITAIGGLLIAGALSSSDYMMQIAQFRGVKLAQLLPLVIVLAVTLGTTYAGADAKGWRGLRRGWITAAEAFVKYWHAIAIFVALGAVGFMLMRSGNDSAVEVSGLEMKLRALLDQILIVRPRTKEIMLGYPALMMGLSLLMMRRRRAAWIWLTIGTIGVISATNTFCHLHTPLEVSLLRVVNGLWVGLLVGIVWWMAKSIGERILERFWWNNDL